MDKEQHIIQSWSNNARSWINIIDNNGIQSRRLVTNKAIIDKVAGTGAVFVLDIGCGEGWLAKELSGKGMHVTGVDVIPELIEKARQKINGEFIVGSYDDIYKRKINFPNLFDAIVINFALFGKESTENLLASLPGYLSENGKLIIQTLNPYSRKATGDYTTGWKQGSWDGLGDRFTNPYEWYFRTLEDWLILLDKSGFKKIKVNETIHPHSSQHLSVLFECSER